LALVAVWSAHPRSLRTLDRRRSIELDARWGADHGPGKCGGGATLTERSNP
jgi:hypothetical protein